MATEYSSQLEDNACQDFYEEGEYKDQDEPLCAPGVHRFSVEFRRLVERFQLTVESTSMAQHLTQLIEKRKQKAEWDKKARMKMGEK